MAWVATDLINKGEAIFPIKPLRGYNYWYVLSDYNRRIALPKGSIKKLIGRDLDWSNDPVELKEE